MNAKRLALISMLLLFFGAPSPSPGSEASKRGQRVFKAHCAVCHGVKGDGQGPEANRFFTRPTDLTRGSFKFRSTPTGSLPTDDDLDRTIRHGLPGSGMIAQDQLRGREFKDVIAYLKTLSSRRAAEPLPVPIPLTPPANLDSLAVKGVELYKSSGCPECHGTRGEGDGPSAKSLTSSGRPTRPANLTRRPFKGGNRPEDIYRALATGLDGTPMPSYRDALEEKDLWALAAYVASLVPPKAKPFVSEDDKIGREVESKHQPGRRRQ